MGDSGNKSGSPSASAAGSPPAGASASPAKSPPKSPTSAASPASGQGQPIDFHSAQHWIEAGQNFEPHDDDRDSAAGDDDHGSSTASLTSSILHYRTISGRTYHSERGNANYWAANDEKQNESMDIHHHLLTLVLDSKLFRAPIQVEKLKKVLDVGTGTGIWAIDFADAHPNVSVTGTDISPIQPGWVPPNLEFVIDDCTQPWTFDRDSFDYIHMRYLFGSIVDWPALYREAYRACAPGGWVESHEANAKVESNNNSMPQDSALNEWTKFFYAGEEKLGRPFMIIDLDLQKKGMEEAGFVDIDIYDIKVPMGGWAKDPKRKEMGQYLQLALETDMEGYILYIASMILGWTQAEVTVYCAQMRRELRSGKYQPMYQQRVVCGRKPK